MRRRSPRKRAIMLSLTAALLMLTAAAILMIASPAASAATENNVSYLDSNNNTQYANNVTVLAGAGDIPGSTLTSGWYLVRGTFTVPDTIVISGDVHLILENGCDITSSGLPGDAGVNVTGTDSLTIYAQSASASTMGALTASGGGSTGAGIGGNNGQVGGIITINGGIITANGTDDGAGIGGGGNGSSGGTTTINGGIVTAGSGNGAGIGGGAAGGSGSITITGGTVTALLVGNYFGAGIGAGIGGVGGTVIISGGTVAATGGGATASDIGNGAFGGGVTILIYGKDTVVHADGGRISGGTGAAVFVALPHGNLTGPSGPLGNAVDFTADPLTVTGTVIATLPAPFNAAPFGTGVIELMSAGLGPNTSASTPSKMMSIHTTLAAQTIDFALADYSDSAITQTGTQLTTPGASVDFHVRTYYEVTVNITGTGSVGVSDGGTLYGTVTPSTSGRTFKIPNSVPDIYLTATAGSGYTFNKFTVNSADSTQSPLTVTMDSDKSATAAFAAVPPVTPSTHYITTSSDTHSAISPNGTVPVPSGGSQTFTFSADAGYYVSSVTVDGTSLPAAVSLGYHTFTNVMANHTITVGSSSSPPAVNFILTVDVKEGKGRAEYSVNGLPFAAYSVPVTVQAGSSVVLKAYADSGYGFKEWRVSGTAHSQPELSLGSINSSVQADLYFSDDISYRIGSLWWIFIVMVLIILTAVMIWLFFYRRYYDVLKPESVIGNGRVHRKSEYRFETAEGYSGKMSYRIGEDGEWKPLFPDKDGAYVIPKNEITDDIYLEERP